MSSTNMLERLQNHQMRVSLATQQNSRSRSKKPLEAINETDNKHSYAFFLRRNTSEFAVAGQEEARKLRGSATNEGGMGMPKNGGKQVSFISPRGSNYDISAMQKKRVEENQDPSSLENGSLTVKSPIFDRRHLRTRGTTFGTGSFDLMSPNSTGRGDVFSSFSKGSQNLFNNISSANIYPSDKVLKSPNVAS